MRQVPATSPASRDVRVTRLLRDISPIIPAATSDGLDWPGVQALRFHAAPSFEIVKPGLPLHSLVLVTSPPEKLELQYDSVRYMRPFPAGSIVFAPASVPMRWRWTGPKDSFHLYLDPELVARVAAESFDLSLEIPPLEVLSLPELRNAMLTLDAELTRGPHSCRILVESLATMLAVHLIRHVSRPRPTRQDEAALPRRKLDAVLDYIRANLDTGLSLAQMAAVAYLSPYHFARQFKSATGLPPHKYVVARRVERAQQLLREDRDFTVADVALRAGFSDQSQLSAHFKRIVGMTPRQFQLTARIA
jgi:AraC family transcriptional regulator